MRLEEKAFGGNVGGEAFGGLVGLRIDEQGLLIFEGVKTRDEGDHLSNQHSNVHPSSIHPRCGDVCHLPASMLPLPVVGSGSVFAEVVLFKDVLGDGGEGGIERVAAEGHLGAHFEGDAVVE